MDAKSKSATSKTYTVAGKTLADINKDISKKGPVDPNDKKRYAGSCLGELVLAITDKDLTYVTTPGSSPVEVTATPTGGTITSVPTITMPKLGSDKDLSDPAKKEWKRFIAKTQVHEDGHADSIFELAKTIAGELNALSATETGANEKAAQVAAGKALFAQMSTALGGGVLTKRINDDIKAYDAKTQHGATQGAVLDTDIT